MRGLLSAAALLVLLGGCSAGSDEGQVTKSVRAWTDAVSRADGNAACSSMTDGARMEFGAWARAFRVRGANGECAHDIRAMAMRLSGNALRQIHDADVDQVVIDGDVARIHFANGGPNEMVMRRLDDNWVVDQAFRKGWRLVGAPSFGMTGG